MYVNVIEYREICDSMDAVLLKHAAKCCWGGGWVAKRTVTWWEWNKSPVSSVQDHQKRVWRRLQNTKLLDLTVRWMNLHFLIPWIEHLHFWTSFRQSVFTVIHHFPFGWSATIVLRRDLDVEHWIELLDPWPHWCRGCFRRLVVFSPYPKWLCCSGGGDLGLLSLSFILILYNDIYLFIYDLFIWPIWNPGTEFEGIANFMLACGCPTTSGQISNTHGFCGLKQHNTCSDLRKSLLTLQTIF